MKKVSAEQIQQLYKFTRQHYVEHYDVQTELVDHLANDIETIWQENPNLTFEEARDRSFKKFGVFGFMNMYEARQKELSKKYVRILWQYAKEWFKLPKILATITLFLVFYTIFKTSYGIYFFFGIFLLLIIYMLVNAQKLIKKVKQKTKQTGKKWLLEDLIFRSVSINLVVFFVNFFNMAIQFKRHYTMSTWVAIIFSFVLVVGVIYAYVSIKVLPNKAEDLLNEQYPEYKLKKG